MRRHRELNALLQRIVAADTAYLPALLDELSVVLQRHFAHEERPGGFYGAVAARSPRLADAGAGLVREHRQLGADLGRMVDEAGAALTGDCLRAAAVRFVERLQRHEWVESRLLDGVLPDEADAASRPAAGDPSHPRR